MVSVEPMGDLEEQRCECCGTAMLIAKGILTEAGDDLGTYRVSWTPDQLEHESHLDLVLGDWGETAKVTDRFVVSVVHRLHEGRPQFLIIDAAETFPVQSEAFGAAMNPVVLRELGMTSKIYSYVEQIVLQDVRLYDLTGGWGPENTQ